MSNEGFSFKKLYEDSKKALFQPKEYFSSMETQGGLGEPILKVLVYGAIAGVFALLWSLLNISGFTGGILGGAVGIAAFFWSIFGAVVGVFIGGLIVLIISSICNGKGEFEPNMRVAAAIMVILPINAFLGFFGGISGALDAIIGFAVNIYGLYMLYIAVTRTLEGKVQPAKAISYILAGLVLIGLIANLATRRTISRKMNLGSSAVEEYQKKAEQMAKEMSKEYEKAAKEMEKSAKEMEKSMNTFHMEMANGEKMSEVDKSDLRKALKELDEDNNFISLRKGATFVQAAVTDDGYLMEYRDNTGYFESEKADLSESEVKDIMYAFLEGKKDWKDEIEWQKAQ
jgi:hypothetical protein